MARSKTTRTRKANRTEATEAAATPEGNPEGNEATEQAAPEQAAPDAQTEAGPVESALRAEAEEQGERTTKRARRRRLVDPAAQPPNGTATANHDGQAACACGCGWFPRGKRAAFVQGHDARLAGSCRRLIAGKPEGEDAAAVAAGFVALEAGRLARRPFLAGLVEQAGPLA